MSSDKRKLLLCSATLIVPLLLAGCSADQGAFGSGQHGDLAGASAHELGVYHFEQGHYGLAIQSFERATKKGESVVESLNGLGASYDQLGRFDLAEGYYRRALKLEPQSAQTLNNIGYSYWMQGKYDLALAFLRDADKLDAGNRLIAANRAMASASLAEQVDDTEAARMAALKDATAAVANPAFGKKRGPYLERTSSYEQQLVLQAPAVPAAFAGLPDGAEVAARKQMAAAGRSDAAPLSLSYLPDATALDVPAADDGALPQPLVTAAAPTPAQARQPLVLVPLVAVEEMPLPALAVPAVAAAAAPAPASDEVATAPAVETEIEPAAPAAPAVAQLAAAPAAAPVAAEPVITEPVAAATNDRAAAAPASADGSDSGFLASLLADIKAFFSGSEASPETPNAVAATTAPAKGASAAPREAYVGPYGTEAGGRHRSLGLAQPDQYAVAHPRIAMSDASGQAGTAARVGAYLAGRGLPVAEALQPGEAVQMAASRPVTTIYYGAGWEAYASGLAATLPADVELRPASQEGMDIRIEVGADLADFDRDPTAADSSRRDDIAG